MKKIWEAEKFAIVFTASWILLIGVFSHNWVVAILLPLLSYIIWIYIRLVELEKWLSHGSITSQVIDDNGFIGLITLHLYKQKKINKKKKKRIKELLHQLNTNISALPDATILLNQDFEIEWANAPATYLLGIKRDDIGQHIYQLIRQPEFSRYLTNPTEKTNLEIQSPLDQNIMLQIKVVSFGKNQRLIIVRNISDQKQLQEALKHFVAHASHELQTPLTSIIGYLEMLEMEPGLSDIGKKSITVIQQQSQRMKHLIQDLLVLSRVESYQLQPQEGKQISVSDCMNNVMTFVGKSCNYGTIRCDIPEGFFLLGIQSEIEGICINLIENAIKHSPENTPVKIDWTLNSDNEYIFSVTDKGNGIDEHELPHITDRYYRGSHTTSEQVSGSGLGLAIVQQAAQKHGATLNITSKPGQGSSFSVTFPSYRTIQHKPQISNIYSL